MQGNGWVACGIVLALWAAPVEAAGPEQDMVWISGGSFMMGADDRDGQVGIDIGVDSMPRHLREVDGFWIDRYEVNNLDYRVFVRATGRQVPVDPRFAEYFSWEKGEFPEGLGRHPVVYVDWDDATAYCDWVDKRLPTEAEWEKAARGVDGRHYPWGDGFDAGRCNVRESRIQWTVPRGSFEGDVSPYGVRDMCGNVSEWTADWYQAYPGSSLQRASFGTKYKVTRGGSWMLPGNPFSRTANRTLSFDTEKRHRAIGFRCAGDAAEPTG